MGEVELAHGEMGGSLEDLGAEAIVLGLRLGEGEVQPAPALGPVALDPPERGASAGDAKDQRIAAEGERGPDLVVLLGEPRQPGFLVGAVELRFGAFNEIGDPAGMARADLRALAGRVELLDGMFPDGLEHPIPVARGLDEALLDERLERIELGLRDHLGRFEAEAGGEDPESSEEDLLRRRQELVRPLDGRPERPLAGVAVAGATEVEPLADAVQDPGRCQDRRRAAASSMASGRSSSPAHKAAISSVDKTRTRAEQGDPSSGASGGTR